MRSKVMLAVFALAGMAGLLAGCGGGSSSSHPRGFFGYFPEPDDSDLPRDALFAVPAAKYAVTRMRLYRWRDRDDDFRAYGDELSRVAGRRYYDRVTGEHILAPGNDLRPFARYLLVVRYREGVERIWALETGDWFSGRGEEEGARRWRAPAGNERDAAGSKGKSWRTP